LKDEKLVSPDFRENFGFFGEINQCRTKFSGTNDWSELCQKCLGNVKFGLTVVKKDTKFLLIFAISREGHFLF
jgi:hypothetical protein